ncbi:MAG: carbamoyltransferase HypF [Gammaproteobacteria bacterium]|nr:carbamoyltransferase HypF [Gammaproteobacteria bacterium]
MLRDAPVTRHWVVTGHVQGVGFRPFVYRLAHRYGLSGWVRNTEGRVEILAQGEVKGLDAFARKLERDAPKISRPRIDSVEPVPSGPLEGFAIRSSAHTGRREIHLPPDYFTCEDCLRELADPAARRYRYPFINCTQCGPRYTIIRGLPYDRASTTMAGFPLCGPCRAEYEDPLDRRFHAEPVACASCGPSLSWVRDGETIDGTPGSLAACVAALAAGRVVAVKGIGGYHLMCDARSDAAVLRLRERKKRPDKPLAVLFPATAGPPVSMDDDTFELLSGPARPIVLLPDPGGLSRWIAPGLKEVGVMFPYSPLHHLLLADVGGPLVATSGNISGEPVLTENREAGRRLRPIADAFLHHDRPIERPADDPVFRPIAGRPRPIRIGRGMAPLELPLPWRLRHPVLAVGGHLKNTVALAWEDRVVVSPHIGDMDSPRSLAVFEAVVADLQVLYGVEAVDVVRDAHPDYTTTRWVRSRGVRDTAVLHHHAHASALYGECRGEGDWLVFTWDGTGYGGDGTIWGGEVLHGRPGAWRRVGSFRPFRLPGGDRAGREPWRSAAALCWELGIDWNDAPEGVGIARVAWDRRLNCPVSTAAGRLFDAAAAIVLGVTHVSYEGQGPMQLEAIAGERGPRLALPLTESDGLLRMDWAPLMSLLMDDGRDRAERARGFHETLAGAIVDVAGELRHALPFGFVGLTGGVFQNRLLCELAKSGLESRGHVVQLCEQVPCNDGGICFGQIIEHAAREAG